MANVISEAKAQELAAKGMANLTNDELLDFIAYTKTLQTQATKAAKERKLDVPKAKKTATVASPEMALLAEAFQAIVLANVDFIKTLFPAPTAEKPYGQKGANVATAKECPYYIQILNKEAYELERAANKTKKATAVPTQEQVDAAEAAKTSTI